MNVVKITDMITCNLINWLLRPFELLELVYSLDQFCRHISNIVVCRIHLLNNSFIFSLCHNTLDFIPGKPHTLFRAGYVYIFIYNFVHKWRLPLFLDVVFLNKALYDFITFSQWTDWITDGHERNPLYKISTNANWATSIVLYKAVEKKC